ncbi:MAG: motility associated factor glycosyltransferase family protein [Lachnospiraceae bacterium]|nr:motility associated factor glycosyltransferase family protein [Lachnospiraceae bacterium]
MGITINNIYAKDGTEIIEIHSNDKSYRMNSLYNPMSEAVKYAAQFNELCNGTVLIIYGYGNGIFPQAIIEEYSDKGVVVFYEPNALIAKYIKSHMQHNELTESNNVYYVSPDLSDNKRGYYLTSEFPLLLEKIITYSNYEHIEVACLPHYREIFGEEYEKLIELVRYRVRHLRSNIEASKLMGKEAVINNIMNLQYISDSYCADSLIGIFSERLPAVIVSAGPSLEKNVHVLRQMKNMAFIVCVDTAAGYLIQEGVVPDLIVSVDPDKPVVMFEDDRIKEIPMAVATDINYQVLEKMKYSRIIFCSTENSYIQSLYRIGGHSINKLRSGGSVATMAMSLCIYWGFHKIILVGQDLALSGEKLYAGNSAGNEVGREVREIEGIEGNQILTYTDYYSYLLWFEQTIMMYPELEFIDATEGGAKISGTRIAALEEVKNECCDYTEDISAKLESVKPSFDDIQRDKIKERIHNSLNTLKVLITRLTEGIQIAKRASRIAVGNNMDIGQLESLDKKMQDISGYYNTIEEDYFIQRYIDATELEQFMSLFENIEELSRQDRYRRMEQYFEILLRAAEVVCNEWEQMLLSN